MMKIGAFAAASGGLLATALLASPAMAQTVTAGNYKVTTQYTGLIDPNGICASLTPVGSVTAGAGHAAGLGGTAVETINVPAAASPYGVGFNQCSFAALPAASAFTLQSNGTYTASPTGVSVTSCTSSSGIAYTLSSSNNASSSPPSTLTITILKANGTLSSFKQTATNTTVAIGGSTICYLSTDALWSRSGV